MVGDSLSSDRIKNYIFNLFSKTKEFSNRELLLLRYGIDCLYIFLNKNLILLIIGLALGITKELYTFILFYGLLRSFSGGFHLNSSSLCTLYTILILLMFVYICINININYLIKTAIFIFSVIIFILYSPSDTKKKPIVCNKKKYRLKITSIIILVIYYLISLQKNSYISNCLSLIMILQVTNIIPITYKIFKLSYNNGKYLRKEQYEIIN